MVPAARCLVVRGPKAWPSAATVDIACERDLASDIAPTKHSPQALHFETFGFNVMPCP